MEKYGMSCIDHGVTSLKQFEFPVIENSSAKTKLFVEDRGYTEVAFLFSYFDVNKDFIETKEQITKKGSGWHPHCLIQKSPQIYFGV